jgi:predicted DNA-binding transcriptional regulator AlpA
VGKGGGSLTDVLLNPAVAGPSSAGIGPRKALAHRVSYPTDGASLFDLYIPLDPVDSHLIEHWPLVGGLGTGASVEPAPNPVATVDVKTLPATIAFIRATISLNTSELAKVLGVGRPTIYSWADGNAVPKEQHLSRLARLYRIASAWANKYSEPLSEQARAVLIGGRTFVDTISDASLPEQEIIAAVLAIKLPSAPTGAFESFLEDRGLRISRLRRHTDEFDRITGKRIDDQ